MRTDAASRREDEDPADKFLRMLKKAAFWGFGSIIGLVLFFSSFFTTELGYNYIVQDKLFGTTRMYSEPGFYLKIPFFTSIQAYKQVATVDFGAGESGEFTRSQKPVSVTFADTYSGTVPATFRYKLPLNEQQMIMLHKEFRSFDNLVDALLVKTSRDVLVVTATQYTGEEFFQGGLNSYKVKLGDQLRNGLYETVRKQVEVERLDVAPVSANQADAGKVEKQTQLVWKNVVLQNNEGQPKRLENPFSQYGLTVTQVTVGKPDPGSTLEGLLTDKKKLVAKRITAVQELETAKAEARSVQQQMEIERRKEVMRAQKKKELAIIDAQREVDLERKKAERETVQKEKEKRIAVLEKERELEVAQRNEAIQAANAKAAKHEAEAIKSKGLAEAEVERAMLLAKQEAADIYLAEMQRDIARVMYPNLKHFTVDMPDFFYGGNGANGDRAPTSLDVMTTLGAMDRLKAQVQKSSDPGPRLSKVE